MQVLKAPIPKLKILPENKASKASPKPSIDLPSIIERSPKWALPLLAPARYKGAWGGRGGGKSYQFAEMLIDAVVQDKDLKAVCIREYQKSLKFSAKMLIEETMERLGYDSLFRIMDTEIRRIGGKGIIIFQGMQDHTADSIKSLQGFKVAWVEEAQNLSARSLKLLRPTIREEDSEIWFSWNPENESDPVDKFLRKNTPNGSIVVQVNYTDNPYLPDVLRKEAESDRATDIDDYNHVWLGGYNKKSKEQVFAGKWVVDSFEPTDAWDGPYFGLDFGFSQDPLACVKAWIYQDYLYVEYASYHYELELDDTHRVLSAVVPDCDRYNMRADSAWSQSIAHLQRHGFPYLAGVKKWPNSVVDGIKHIRKYQKIIIHERCTDFIKEMELYKYKVDKRSGEILPDIVDKDNHGSDSLRYALAPVILNSLTTIDVSTTEDTRTIYSEDFAGY